MLERESELIKQIILESTLNGRVSIKLSEVFALNLPHGAKAFMTSHVMELLESEFKQSRALSHTIRSASTSVVSERALLRSLAMEYVLQADEYQKLVEDTVHFLENYLCRPQWTLNQLMFENREKISFDSLVKKFECVVDYAYYSVLVERYARRMNLQEMSSDQFGKLLSAIDHEIVRQHSPLELARLTKPIFDFLSVGDAPTDRPIPLGAILLFYDDKKMTAAKDYIERICQVRSRTQISMNELIGILEDLYHVESTVKEEVNESELEILRPREQAVQKPEELVNGPATPEAESLSISPEEAVLTPPVQAATPDQPAQSAETALPLPPEGGLIHAAEPAETGMSPEEPSTQLPHTVHAEEMVTYAREREAKRFASFLTFPEKTTKEEQAVELPDVQDVLTNDQKATFMRTIFNNDEHYYLVFLASLNKTTTWRDAQPYLRELFALNKLDILSPAVVEFTDAMQARFHPELRKT